MKEELNKILLFKNPEEGLEQLRERGALKDIIPELCATYNMTQNEYHFGTVWEHTSKVVEQVPAALLLRMAALLHDIGKINTRTVTENGKVRFIGHEIESEKLTRRILRRLNYEEGFVDEVCFLVRSHMILKFSGPEGEKLKGKKLRRIQHLCETKERFENLMALIHADNCAHARVYCMPEQIPSILIRSERMEAKGMAMFNYRLPLTRQDVMRMKHISNARQVDECMEYLWKLAISNPLRSREEFEKHIVGYKLEENDRI